MEEQLEGMYCMFYFPFGSNVLGILAKNWGANFVDFGHLGERLVGELANFLNFVHLSELLVAEFWPFELKK